MGFSCRSPLHLLLSLTSLLVMSRLPMLAQENVLPTAAAAVDPQAASIQQAASSAPSPLTMRQILEALTQIPNLFPPAGSAEPRMMRNLSDATHSAPNTWLRQGSVRQDSTLFVRGLGGSVSNPYVTTYLDGVPQLHGYSANVELLDVEEVSLLAGPQGTALPRQSLGGALWITSRRPNLTNFQAEMESTYGNYNLYDFRGRISTPLIQDQLGFSFAGGYQERDGFSENPTMGHDLDSRSASFGKAQFLWTPDPALEVRLIISGESDRDGDDALNDLDALRRTSHQGSPRDLEGYSHRDILQPTLHITYHGDHFDFSSITGYTWWETDRLVDLDQSAEFPTTYVTTSVPGTPPVWWPGGPYFEWVTTSAPADRTDTSYQRLRTHSEQHSFSQQFQLSNPANDPINLTNTLKLDWQLGAFFQHSRFDQHEYFRQARTQATAAPQPFTPEPEEKRHTFTHSETTSFSAYLNTQWTYRERVRFNTGLRWDVEKTTIAPSIQRNSDPGILLVWGPGQTTEYIPYLSTQVAGHDRQVQSLTPDLSLSFELTPNLVTYLSFTGGRQQLTTYRFSSSWNEPDFYDHDQARSWSYEWGLQGRALKDRAHFSLALFYTDLRNLQVDVHHPDRTDDTYYNRVRIEETADASSYGLETSVDWSPLPCWQLYGQASLTQATYRQGSHGTVDGEGISISGNQLPYSPDYTATAGTLFTWQLRHGLSFYAGAEVQFVGPYHFDSSNAVSQDAFTLTHFRLGLRHRHWFAEAWAQNAFDTEYISSAHRSLGSRYTSDFVYLGESGPPATFGLRVGVRF